MLASADSFWKYGLCNRSFDIKHHPTCLLIFRGHLVGNTKILRNARRSSSYICWKEGLVDIESFLRNLPFELWTSKYGFGVCQIYDHIHPTRGKLVQFSLHLHTTKISIPPAVECMLPNNKINNQNEQWQLPQAEGWDVSRTTWMNANVCIIHPHKTWLPCSPSHTGNCADIWLDLEISHNLNCYSALRNQISCTFYFVIFPWW